jgi:hypothetical protein
MSGYIDILERLAASPCSLEDVQVRLNELLAFLKTQQAFLDAHLVNFFTEDLWGSLVPEEWRDDLERLTDNQMTYSSTEALEEIIGSRSLTEFMKECRRLSLKGGKTEIRKMSDLFSGEEITAVAMSDKKRHEVNRMTSFVGFLAKAVDINQVIDIGSGRGYLSESLALSCHLKTIGLDSKEGNTKSARKRNQLVEKLSKHASKGHVLSYLPVTEMVDVQDEHSFLDRFVEKYPGIVDANEPIGLIGLHTCGGLSHVIQRLFLCHSQFRFLCYVGCCYHLQSECDEGFPLSLYMKKKGAILSQTARNYCQKRRVTDLAMGAEVEPEVTLGINQTKLEASNKALKPEMTSKVNQDVMSELNQEVTSYTASNQDVFPNKECTPLRMEVPKEISTVEPDVISNISQTKPKGVSFPPKVALKTKPEVTKLEVSTSKSLFYRAALQWIIANHLGESQDRFQVGKLYTKCDGFVDYVQKALKRIGVSCPDSLTAAEIQSTYEELKLKSGLLHRFSFLQTLLAPCVESLILLDRLCHLMESEMVTQAFIIPLFDNSISARNKAIVAFKTLT